MCLGGYRNKEIQAQAGTLKGYGASKAHLANVTCNKFDRIQVAFTHHDQEKTESILANINNSYAGSHIMLNLLAEEQDQFRVYLLKDG